MKQAAIRKFSTIHSPPLTPNEPGVAKKSVPGPTSPWHVFSLLLFSILRRPMSISANTKAGFYLCVAAGGSLFFDFVRAPPSYFSNKYNLFNQIFVKWGWGWTCIVLALFMTFSTFVYTAGNIQRMRSHILRLVIGTAFWYIWTGFISFIHDATGQCHPSNVLLTSGQRPSRRVLCHRAGGSWLGFDISGHCFLLSMANLWIMEELRCMQYWSKLADILKPYDDNGASTSNATGRASPDEVKTMRSAFRRLTGPVRIIYSLAASISILWDLMFLTTIVYFHTMPSKLLGTALGVFCWFITYRLIFPCTRAGKWFGLAPGMPGDGPVDFVPRR